MKVNSKKIIKRVVNEKDDIESLGKALVYLSNNFDLTINDPRVYRDYLVNVYQIIHCLKFDNSITWWGLNLLINLQNQSVTNDNIIARELIRRYVEFRNKAFEYVDADKLETIIDSLPSYNDDHFSMEFQDAKKR